MANRPASRPQVKLARRASCHKPPGLSASFVEGGFAWVGEGAHAVWCEGLFPTSSVLWWAPPGAAHLGQATPRCLQYIVQPKLQCCVRHDLNDSDSQPCVQPLHASLLHNVACGLHHVAIHLPGTLANQPPACTSVGGPDVGACRPGATLHPWVC